MANFGEVMREGAEALRHAGADNPLQEAALLLCDVAELTHTQLVLKENEDCLDDVISKFTSLLLRRVKGESVRRIIGGREFHGLYFELNEETLEPRDDTETLIDLVMQFIDKKSAPFLIADLGTGPGTVALSLLTELPNARVVATDVSEKALEMAQQNALSHGLSDRLFIAQGSWCDALAGMFDIIVSNPPYIASGVVDGLAKEVRDHDPHLALDGGKDGLEAYRTIFADVGNYLNDGGFLALEIGFDQIEKVVRLGYEYGWSLKHSMKDLNGHDRALAFSRA